MNEGSRAPSLLIVAPHFAHPGHLGAVRTERFLRWASGAGYGVCAVRGGSADRKTNMPWGTMLTIRDPLAFYRDDASLIDLPRKPRTTNRLRRALAYLLMIPDPVVLWARRVCRSPLVRSELGGVARVLSSSPPESCHVAAFSLARRLGVPHLVDLRDGWLDEPMIPLLAESRVQRARHRRLENRILRAAQHVLVTSETWRRLLVGRFADLDERISVVTNTYPEGFPTVGEARREKGRRLRLIYAGKIHSSRPERRVDDLLQPLLQGCERCPNQGSLEFIGNLLDEEASQILEFRTAFADLGWQLSVQPPVSRTDLFGRLVEADGLLLLSASVASIPAKIFDYIPARRPVLAVAPEQSATADVAARTPHVFLQTIGKPSGEAVELFFDRCAAAEPVQGIPPEFSEAAVCGRFTKLLRS